MLAEKIEIEDTSFAVKMTKSVNPDMNVRIVMLVSVSTLVSKFIIFN